MINKMEEIVKETKELVAKLRYEFDRRLDFNNLWSSDKIRAESENIIAEMTIYTPKKDSTLQRSDPATIWNTQFILKVFVPKYSLEPLRIGNKNLLEEPHVNSSYPADNHYTISILSTAISGGTFCVSTAGSVCFGCFLQEGIENYLHRHLTTSKGVASTF